MKCIVTVNGDAWWPTITPLRVNIGSQQSLYGNGKAAWGQQTVVRLA
jgi:hypothetical protein